LEHHILVRGRADDGSDLVVSRDSRIARLSASLVLKSALP